MSKVSEKLTPRPILRWAGSKRKLLPKLVEYWRPDATRYVEPFVGSAALFYAIRPSTALLGDLNLELVQTLRALRDNADAVYDRLISIPRGEDSYYALRAVSPSSLDDLARAARFIFLNRFCFNGLYRTDMKGRFNVPFAATKTGDIPARANFLASAAHLQSAVIEHSDFETLVTENVRSLDFVYLDPPYAVGNRRIFSQYGPQTFGLNDLQRLGGALELIDRRGAYFVLSYAYCAEALAIFSRWVTRKVYCQRNIAGFAKHRRRAAELIVTNFVTSTQEV